LQNFSKTFSNFAQMLQTPEIEITRPERAICKDGTVQETGSIHEEETSTKRFGCQKWAKVVTCLVLLGSILFITLPSMQNTPRLVTIILKIWYTIAIPMSIFGYISITRHHPTSINIYCFYFGFNAFLSLCLSTVAIVMSIETWNQEKTKKCSTEMCMSHYKSLIVACANGIQILFWIFAIFVMKRFYVKHRNEYLQWKNDYRQDCHQSQYHHWAFKHQISRSNSSSSTNPLV
jgi:hypothetical protein